jgi:hypothetical protein
MTELIWILLAKIFMFASFCACCTLCTIFVIIFAINWGRNNVPYKYLMPVVSMALVMVMTFSTVTSIVNPREYPLLDDKSGNLLVGVSGSSIWMTKNVQRIQVVDDDSLRFLVTRGSNHMVAFYSPYDSNIYVKKEYAANSNTIIHELGHNVWYTQMNSTQRDEFKKLNIVEGASTEYGKTNVEEDFADSFTLFYMSYKYYVDNKLMYSNNLQSLHQEYFVKLDKELRITRSLNDN